MSGDATEWFKRFEICSKANQQNDTKAVKLPTLLEGEVFAIWLGLSKEEQDDISVVKEKLINAMKPTAFVSLEDFHRQKLHPSELVSVFVHNLKGLLDRLCWKLRRLFVTSCCYPNSWPGSKSQIRASVNIKILDAAVECARLLMSLGDSNHTAAVVPEIVSD